MQKKITYKSAGVDISKADRFVQDIKPIVKATNRKGVVGSIGNFGGFFNVPKGYKDPVMVGATDGVGTKLLVANAQNKHDTIGIDLVAMNVNDIVACGAEPLFFLDYFATGHLENKKAVQIIKGIAEGCKQAGCAIIGGETAEMPGLYAGQEYDLAGFCVGIVERNKILNGSKVRSGDVVVGLHSTGLHSNGYSLARKVFSKEELESGWGKILLIPTKIYVKPVLELHKLGMIKAVAHITGGGFYENINRTIPKNKNAVIQSNAWNLPEVFKEIQRRTKAYNYEMYRTFNMGIGMTLIAGKKDADKVQAILSKWGITSDVIGEITVGTNRIIVQ